MGTKRKAATQNRQQDAHTSEVGRSGEDQALILAKIAVCPTAHSAVTIKEYTKHFGDVEIVGLLDMLSEQVKTTHAGDLKRVEAMLTVQAHTLDAIFNNLARRAINSDYMPNLDCCLKLALRAQSQCRATLETLTTIKNPPSVSFVRQANIAHGHQQVNNTLSPAIEPPRARENDNLQNKLLEQRHGERLDFGTPGTAGSADSAMAAVGEVDRTQDDTG